MYLVTGMVVRRVAGPGTALSYIIAAVASLFSGVCYAEFGVRLPNTTGSAYTYAYIGTSSCARALSACFDSLCNGVISEYFGSKLGTIFGKPPDIVAFIITILMTSLLVGGVKKSLFFNNILNIINLSAWVFIVTAGLFYAKWDNWETHDGFLPYGWSGVFTGAATCFYAFIGFDIIATTGEEATNPKRSIPLAIVSSLAIVLVAYVSCSLMLTLIVPYNEVSSESALVDMFAYVSAPKCQYIVALGALAGLTVSMFGSMFPLPRVVYAMAQDGLIFRQLASISSSSGTPAFATFCGGGAASVIAMIIPIDVLVEMMSIGTLLAYTMVSTCVMILRYQPHITNLMELLPQTLRTPVDPEAAISGPREAILSITSHTQMMPQRVMVRRVTRSSPDSEESMAGEDSDYDRDDAFLVNSENNFYAPPGPCTSGSRFTRFWNALQRKMFAMSYLCPGFLPWMDCGPATEYSGMFVIKSVGVMYVLVIMLDVLAAYGSPSTSTFTAVVMVLLALAILMILLMISRKPQNRYGLIYATPGVPFIPAIAIIVNIYLILNLSILTLIRFTIWMILGLFMYFKYGIKNSVLETEPLIPREPTPPPRNPLERSMIPQPSAQPEPQRVFLPFSLSINYYL
ncbi:unnamed protein product [Leptidea sinapis]|uniref:Cationic amino acid transporter C-terminal domain-containing protein n=1 Tax=Leptidea sinapis TaxID=189913 RepID=A0A5E4PXF0_9NEOP|nr:unnamed protein product [Leptidea sinapis]